MTTSPTDATCGPYQPGTALQVAVEVHPSAGSNPPLSVMTLVGDLDLHSVPRMRSATDLALPAADPGTSAHDVVVDIEAVDFVDSAGLGALLTTLRRTTARGGRLAVVGANEHARRLLAMTGVNRVVSLHATLGDAVAARTATA